MNEPTQPMDRQTNFDWPTRMERDKLISLVDFKRTPFLKRNNVSSPALKGVLNRVNRFSENFEGQKVIGQAIGVTRDQAGRALKLLERYDLIAVERKWNGSARRTLNHYRINWNALRLIVESQKQESPPTNAKFPGDQCDISPPTNAKFPGDQCDISPPTNATFPGDQCDISPPTNATLGLTVIEKELEKETTTEAEWSVVVVLLEKLGVGKAREAIATARARNATENEVKLIIERVAKDASIEPSKRAGAIYNQICNPTPAPLPTTRLKRPDYEQIYSNLLYRAKTNGLRPCDLDHDAIAAKAKRICQRLLYEYESHAGASR